ncbi:MAG TPA: diaminopimelate epimerase [Syntrophomonadaceae bacterium]|jgi:diaminopimelate epimerase|nr:diaminopimelate epimerase [Syntrophomonadaceae bacterium]
MEFTKMHGLGNDFVFVEVANWIDADRLQPYAEMICDRHFGVGADGLAAIGRDTEMDIFMRIFNPDGSEPEMCGNAIRCAAKYAYEHGWVDKAEVSVRTLAGPRFPVVHICEGRVAKVTVDMGEPIMERELIPMRGTGSTVGVKAEVGGEEFEITAISMGNPHAVIFVEDIDQIPIDVWGPQLEVHSLFPAKTNVEFVQVLSSRELIMRVWERGAGITMACGTGACATLVASVLNGLTDRAVTIHLPGGDLHIEWNPGNNHVYMTGPASQVFSGTISLE